MKINARIQSSLEGHQATVSTDGTAQSLAIPPKASGPGSGVNGGELLFLALATCYGNDIWREAGKRSIAVESVEVEVSGQFGGPGDPATDVTFAARVVADATEAEIADLMRHTDTVAEIQNTLRQGVAVTLTHVEAVPATM